MENFSQLVKVRRSIRRFTDEPLSQDDVCTLMRAALMSPSSKRSMSWQFVLVDDKDKLQQLSECKDNGAGLIAGAPLAIVVLGDPAASDVWIEDASVASLMLLLQAEDLGLGACWVQVRERGRADGTAAEDVVRGILDIPESMAVLSIVAVGHKAVSPKPFDEDKLKWEKVHLNKW